MENWNPESLPYIGTWPVAAAVRIGLSVALTIFLAKGVSELQATSERQVWGPPSGNVNGEDGRKADLPECRSCAEGTWQAQNVN